MNCNGFKDVLFEYTEGSLAAAELEFAERHLLQCETCRKLVAREQNTSSRVSSLLQQASRDVRLNPEFEQQICCELGTGREKGIEGRKVFSGRRLWERVGGSRRVEDNPPYRGPVRWGASVPASRNWGWRLWAWASAATACLVMVLLIKTGSTTHDRQNVQQTNLTETAAAPVLVHSSYCELVYTFREEQGFVVDNLSCESRTVDITLSIQAISKNDREGNRKKVAL